MGINMMSPFLFDLNVNFSFIYTHYVQFDCKRKMVKGVTAVYILSLHANANQKYV